MTRMVLQRTAYDREINAIQAGQMLEVILETTLSLDPHRLGPLQLRQPYRRVDIWHVVFEPGCQHIVLPGSLRSREPIPDVSIDTMQSHGFYTAMDLLIIGY